MKIPHLGTGRIAKHKNEILGRSFKFLFVREPYGRLFAGYVDKFFSPNTFYWNLVGKYIQTLTRAEENRTICAHDVTFAEFVHYVIQSEADDKNRDRHFTPQYGHCQPCNIRYDFVGKVETFKTDAKYVVDIINKKSNNSIAFDGHLKTQYDVESIKDKVHFWFSDMNAMSKCTPKHELFYIMWRTFQTRGILSKKATFPVSRYEADKLTYRKFLHMVLAAYEKYKTDPERKRNKAEAMIEAYSTVSKEDMEKLKYVVKPDCDLFGYDPQPAKLFDISRDSLPSFKYLDVNF